MDNAIKNILVKIFAGDGLIPVPGKVRITTRRNGKIIRQTKWMKNLVVSSANYGRNLIAQRLGGVNTYTLNVTHGEIGTGTNAPANGDIGLQTGAVRVAITLASVVNNVVSLQFFFSDATLPDGTYTEFGTFIDGAAGLGTGQIFNRVLFSPGYSKSAGEDTTVEVEFTINAA